MFVTYQKGRQGTEYTVPYTEEHFYFPEVLTDMAQNYIVLTKAYKPGTVSVLFEHTSDGDGDLSISEDGGLSYSSPVSVEADDTVVIGSYEFHLNEIPPEDLPEDSPFYTEIKIRYIQNNTLGIQNEEDIEDSVTRYSCLFIKANEDITIKSINADRAFGQVEFSDPSEDPAPLLPSSLTPPDGVTFLPYSHPDTTIDSGDTVHLFIKRTVKDIYIPGGYLNFLTIVYDVDGVEYTHVLSGLTLLSDTSGPNFRLYGFHGTTDLGASYWKKLCDVDTFPHEIPAIETDPLLDKYIRLGAVSVDKYGNESQNKVLNQYFKYNLPDETVIEIPDITMPSLVSQTITTYGQIICVLSYIENIEKIAPEYIGIEYRADGETIPVRKLVRISPDQSEYSIFFDRIMETDVLYRRLVAVSKNVVLTSSADTEVPYTYSLSDVPTQANLANDSTVIVPSEPPAFNVTFNLAGKATRTGGGELTQVVQAGDDATLPTIEEAQGWALTGYDKSHENITADVYLTALYTQDEPIELSSIEDIQLIGFDPAYPLSASYILTDDIDASDTINWNSGNGFEPIGYRIGSSTYEFTGIFNGDGYSISDLYIKNAPNASGLFRYTYNAEIKNLRCINFYIENHPTAFHTATGLLIGHGRGGSLTNCRVSGEIVNGKSIMGGMCGIFTGSINKCFISNVDDVGITINSIGFGGKIIGLLVGASSIGLFDAGPSIEDSYVRGGTVNGSPWSGGSLGGLIGVATGSITNCYTAIENLDPTSSTVTDRGGLVGLSYGVTVTSSYIDVNCGIPDNGYGTIQDTELMQLEETFVDWDFTDIWDIDGSYPFLQ